MQRVRERKREREGATSGRVRIRSDANSIVWAFECYSLSATVGNGDDRRFVHIHIVYPNHISIEIGKVLEPKEKKLRFDSGSLFYLRYSTYLDLHLRLQICKWFGWRNLELDVDSKNCVAAFLPCVQPLSLFSISMVCWYSVGTIILPRFILHFDRFICICYGLFDRFSVFNSLVFCSFCSFCTFCSFSSSFHAFRLSMASFALLLKQRQSFILTINNYYQYVCVLIEPFYASCIATSCVNDGGKSWNT